MDKKVLNGIVTGIIKEIQSTHSLDETESRAMLGMLLKQSRQQIVAAVSVPRLDLRTTA